MNKRLLCATVAVLAGCVGCGKGTADLKARLTLDGKPLEGATVTLVGPSRPAVGTTDAEGKVRFMTFEPGDGVLPGEYKVVVVKSPGSRNEEFANFDPNNPQDVQRMMARDRGGNVPYTPTTLPRIYLNPEQTPLSVRVPPEEEEVVFRLETKPKQ